MLRSSRDFIQLPPLGEIGTLGLVDELEAAAKAIPKLPSPVYSTMGRLLESCAELKRQGGLRDRAGSAADPKARAADRALDDAWGAFQSWLLGWTRLPESAHPRDRVHQGCDGSGCHEDASVAALPAARNVCLACHTKQVDHKPGRDCAPCHLVAWNAASRGGMQ